MSTNYMVTLDMFECVAESDPNRSLPWHHKTWKQERLCQESATKIIAFSLKN